MLIPLTRGLFAEVDEADSWLAGYNWQAIEGWKGRTFYAKRDQGKKCILMHRELFPNIKPEERADHIDGNGLNNKRSNLRIVSIGFNNLNRHYLMSNNTSGVHGLYWNRQKQKWCAEIRIDGKRKHLGFFSAIEDAKSARQKAEKILWQLS